MCSNPPTNNTVVYLDASFGECPSFCTGPRSHNFLSGFLAMVGQPLIWRGWAGAMSWDYIGETNKLLTTHYAPANNEYPCHVIIGNTGEAFSNFQNVLHNGLTLVQMWKQASPDTVVWFLYYPPADVDNSFIRQIVPDLDAWDAWRERYADAMIDAGARPIYAYNSWTPQNIPHPDPALSESGDYHLDSRSSFDAAVEIVVALRRFEAEERRLNG